MSRLITRCVTFLFSLGLLTLVGCDGNQETQKPSNRSKTKTTNNGTSDKDNSDNDSGSNDSQNSQGSSSDGNSGENSNPANNNGGSSPTTGNSGSGEKKPGTKQFDGASIEDTGGFWGPGPFDEISGVGHFVFNDAFPGGSSTRHHITVDFSLENYGTFKLMLYGDKKEAWKFPSSPHIAVTFTRNDSALSLTVVQNVPGQGSVDVLGSANFPAEFDASKPLQFAIDVHNNNVPRPQLLIWRGNEATFTVDRAVFNLHKQNMMGKLGIGDAWGISLNNATVRKAVLSPAKISQ